MNKAAVGISQVFIYIVATVTFALIMIFGFKAITGFIADAQKIEFVQFKSDLENSIERIGSEFGAVRTAKYIIPGSFDQICFVDLDYQPSRNQVAALCQHDPLACTVWQESYGFSGEEENVFLTPPAEARIKVSRISLEQGFLCIPIRNGRFSLLLEGKGDRTKISELLLK